MARQRNNVAILPFELRKLVCRMLLDGCKYAAIDAAVKAEYPQAKTLHGTTLLAYAKGVEYKNYSTGRLKIEPKLAADRWAADALKECAGIETVTDMAEMALANQLRELADKPVAEISDLMKLVRSITAIKRTNLAGKDEEHKQEVKQLKEQHAAEIAGKDTIIAGQAALIDKLKALAGTVDGDDVVDELDKSVGLT